MTIKDEPPFREALVKNADSVAYRPRSMPEYWVNLERENERLRALITKHNDECRECPVIDV